MGFDKGLTVGIHMVDHVRVTSGFESTEVLPIQMASRGPRPGSDGQQIQASPGEAEYDRVPASRNPRF